MSAGFAMRWPVLQRHAVADADLDAEGAVRQDVLQRWVAEVCAEYVGRCAASRPGPHSGSAPRRSRPVA